MTLSAEEKALLLKLRKNGTTAEELKQLTAIAKMIIDKRESTK